MEMRDHVEQERAERNDHHDDPEPEVHERVLVLPRRGRGDAEYKREASEYRGQHFDHVGATTFSRFRYDIPYASDANQSTADVAI